MFGHQDDQHDEENKHHDDQHTEVVVSTPVADDILGSLDDHAAPHTDDSFNPALPPSDDQPIQAAQPSSHSDALISAPSVNDDLLSIKQQALTQLTPIVDHLDQSPEEKFRTTMMMIQAADNKDLIKTAYDAAQAIPDEKVKAQALLDIVNEINYFTQHTA